MKFKNSIICRPKYTSQTNTISKASTYFFWTNQKAILQIKYASRIKIHLHQQSLMALGSMIKAYGLHMGLKVVCTRQPISFPYIPYGFYMGPMWEAYIWPDKYHVILYTVQLLYWYLAYLHWFCHWYMIALNTAFADRRGQLIMSLSRCSKLSLH